MNIILYSSGYNFLNKRLDEQLLSMIRATNPKFTFVPSNSNGAEVYFEKAKTYYQSLGISDFNILPIDNEFNLSDLEKAIEGDIIYLSGGNAFYFLQHIKSTGFDEYLKKFANKGGVILGENAGANIITPTIIAATIPHNKIDKNEVKLTDMTGLKLVEFEFAPHYDDSKIFESELLNYSKQTDYAIYAVPDGSGIAIKDGQVIEVGPVHRFKDGDIDIINN
jgi:dipeptidase E